MKALPQANNDTTRERLETTSWFAVVRAYLECNRRYTEMLTHFDLTITQFDVMTAIDSLGDEALPKAIAERLVVTRANITGVIKRLQERGLVDTVGHAEDGRSFVCVLTQDGKALVESAQAAAARFIRAQAAPFSTKDLKQVETLMRDMHTHLQTLDPEALAQPASNN